MPFYPADATVPMELRTPRLLLRPLRATDVERDYDAVMSSAPTLRAWSQSGWPADDFTLAENLADLERHEREHLAREAFTFTVLDPEGTRCLGCVYIAPPHPEELRACAGAAHPARVAFWVRTSEIAGDLDRHLLTELRAWLREAWAFDGLVFRIAYVDTRQATLLRESGLALQVSTTLADGRTCEIYR